MVDAVQCFFRCGKLLKEINVTVITLIPKTTCHMHGLLTKIIAYISELKEFRYFTICKSLKVNHLSLADDLLLFCKGEAKSVYLLLQGINLFSETTGCKLTSVNLPSIVLLWKRVRL